MNQYLKSEPPSYIEEQIEERRRLPPPRILIPELEREHIREIRRQDLQKIQVISAISLAPIAVLSFVIGYVFVGNSLKPITILHAKIATLKDSDLGTQVDIKTKDEIGQLAQSFNEMSLRLQKAFDLQKQFVQDASHELRTPLAIIQTNLDTALYDKSAKPAELKAAIENALTGIKHLGRLTEQLLTLSLPTKDGQQETDLRELLQEQVESLTSLAKENGVKLSANLPKRPVVAKVHRESLGRAIYNLIENAIKYSTGVESPQVMVETKKDNGKAEIVISDNGPGIPKDQQARIFDRFYRIDKSRSRKTGGFGLGLAIVKKILEEHKGKITLTSKPGETTFRISL